MKHFILLASFLISTKLCLSQSSITKNIDSSYFYKLKLLSGTITKDSLFDKNGNPKYSTAVIMPANNNPTMKLPDGAIVIVCPCKNN